MKSGFGRGFLIEELAKEDARSVLCAFSFGRASDSVSRVLFPQPIEDGGVIIHLGL